MAIMNQPMDIESFWEYSDPALSEERFRQALETAQGDERLELLTQIGRSYGLRNDFHRAHALLDEVEGQLAGAGLRPRLRYLLERGRTYNSSGERERARALFAEAWEQGHSAGEEGLAVDAAHMVAITHSGTPEAIPWTERGLRLARGSQDAKAQALIPAMLNNGAWDLFDTGRFEEALPWFEEAREEWIRRGQPKQIHIARWAVGRCLRALGRHAEALQIHRALEDEGQAAGEPDGFVYEEIGENLAAMGQLEQARAYFAKAAEELGKDEWFVQDEAARLASLRERAAGG
jgi:tetratricopeptide (TPR) repeat protein